MNILFSSICIVALVVQPAIGCSKYYQYFTNQNGVSTAKISVPYQKLEKKVTLEVYLNVPAYTNTKNVGSVKLLNQNVKSDIANGRNLVYEVYFTTRPLPPIHGIFINGQKLCAISADRGTVNAKIVNQFSLPGSGFKCGKRDNNEFTSLIIGGRSARENAFPWLAALYYRNEFICGGSLVSRRLVVTAAHCILDKSEPSPRNPSSSLVYLGRHQLSTYKHGTVTSGVERYIINSDWNHKSTKYDGDIALAVLTTSIQFSPHVSPICLWSKTKSYRDIIGKNGVVSGWGITNNGQTSDAPQFIIIPVVDEIKCLKSHPAFSQILSKKNFCAGGIEQIPCHGDSGGAFIVREGETYYLRGIVSAGIRDISTRCDYKKYTVFTDAALYAEWIHTYIQTIG